MIFFQLWQNQEDKLRRVLPNSAERLMLKIFTVTTDLGGASAYSSGCYDPFDSLSDVDGSPAFYSTLR